MCTAVTYTSCGHFLGRNLDIEKSYGEGVIIMPRNYRVKFKMLCDTDSRYAVIGIGIIADGYPLFYDAANEHGLCMAGLNFIGNAKFQDPKDGKINIAPHEFIPYILTRCKNVKEARLELEKVNLINMPFSRELPQAELHYIIADKSCSIVAEPCENGLNIYDNPVGVLTNNPHFPHHLSNLGNYKNLTPNQPKRSFASGIEPQNYSLGMGAVGLPGDVTSMSRFVRASFTKLNSKQCSDTEASVNQLMHIMASVEAAEGAVRTSDGDYERTEYSAVINLDTLTYYYRTYTNSRISAVRLLSEDLGAEALIFYPMLREQSVYYQN